jgi:glutathione S-transferase
MKLYMSIGPNPAVVAAFIGEKNAKLDVVFVDIMTGENRRPPFVNLNPAGTLPLLNTSTRSCRGRL